MGIGLNLSFLPVVAQGVTAPDPALGAVLQMPIPPYLNTKEIIIYNAEALNACLVKFGDPTTETPATMTILNSTYLPPRTAITFAIGPAGERQAFDANLNLLLLAYAAGTTCAVNVTYVNCRGYTGG